MEDNIKYGLTATCRLPVKAKILLMNEAQKKGVSFSSYMRTFILDALERRDQSQENPKTEVEDSWYNGTRKEKIDVLLKNDQILNELFKEFSSSEIDRKKFVEKGFNFNYGTHTQWLGSEQVISIFSINYCKLNNGKIKILNV